MEDPSLAPDAKRDAGYSVDALRYEQAERYKAEAERTKRVITLLDQIRGLLIVIVIVLAFIAWRLAS